MINTILLSQNDCYVDKDGNLPKRPSFDKELLTAFCKNQVVSENGYNGLPPSMRKIVRKQKMNDEEISLAITIPEIDKYSDVLIIIRSSETLENGKIFRLNNFKNLVKNENIEIWIKK